MAKTLSEAEWSLFDPFYRHYDSREQEAAIEKYILIYLFKIVCFVFVFVFVSITV